MVQSVQTCTFLLPHLFAVPYMCNNKVGKLCCICDKYCHFLHRTRVSKQINGYSKGCSCDNISQSLPRGHIDVIIGKWNRFAPKHQLFPDSDA